MTREAGSGRLIHTIAALESACVEETHQSTTGNVEIVEHAAAECQVLDGAVSD